MSPFRTLVLASLLIVVAPVTAQMPNGEFIEVKGATAAVVLAHGRAQGPDGLVVAPLRRAIAKEAGLHTLSLQMPVLATPDYLAYASTFPDAYETLQAAITFLSTEKGVKRIYVLGYSMGARMTTGFLAARETPPVVGYIGVGVLQGGGEPLDANINIHKLHLPVLDLYADATPLDLSSAENRRALVGAQYRQVRITGANHSFKGYESVLSQTAVAWLREQEGQEATDKPASADGGKQRVP